LPVDAFQRAAVTAAVPGELSGGQGLCVSTEGRQGCLTSFLFN
jgi:hypothetical protein